MDQNKAWNTACETASPQDFVLAVKAKTATIKRCLCFYDAALWDNFTAGSLDKLWSAYVKCIKVFLDVLNIIVLPVC